MKPGPGFFTHSHIFFLALFAVLLFPLLLDNIRATETPPDFEHRIRELLDGRELYLRQKANSSPKVYCNETGQPGTYFLRDADRLFMQAGKIKVRIYGVDYFKAQKRVKIKFKHQRMGKSDLNFYWPRQAVPTLESFKSMIHMVFSQTEADDGIINYVGNRQSKQLHYIGCNHLPDSSLWEKFASRLEAIRKGYTLCEMCFRQDVPLEDSELESYMAAGVASEVSSRYMVCPDDSINALVRRLGAKVLSNWPTALRGYKYKFNVLESRTVNAFAAPGGQIFVLTGLLDAAESENEILGILAHEVTHVERRHGVRQFKSEKKWATIAWLAGFGTGIVLNKTRPNPGATFIIGNLLLEISSLALEIAFSGYSRKFENEADYYAIAFMNSVGDSQSYARIMRKLKYNSNVNGMVGLKSNVFDTHPDINQRVDYANNARVRVFPGGKVFIGYNKDGDRAAEVCFEMQCASRGDEPVPLERPEIGNFRREDFQRYKTVTMLKLFANLTAFPEIGKPCLVKEIKVTAGGRTHRLDNKEDTYLFPLRRVGVTFESNSGDLLEQIEGIELKLREVSFLGKLGKETKLRFVPEGEK